MSHVNFRSRFVGALIVCALPSVVAAQTVQVPVQITAYDTAAFTALKWREIGPDRGGRSLAVAGSSTRPGES